MAWNWTKVNERSGFGTFVLTAVMLVVLVIQSWHAPEPETKTTAVTPSLGIAQMMIPWIPPSIVGMALLIAGLLHIKAAKISASPTQHRLTKTLTPVEAEALSLLWAEWASLGDIYARLDFDNRTNESTRLPFHKSSWPAYGSQWSYVQVSLFQHAEEAQHLKVTTTTFLNAFGWKGYILPEIHEAVVMVDFIRQVREFQEYLFAKKKEFNLIV